MPPGGYDGSHPGPGADGLNIDTDGGSQYGGWQWVGGTKRSFGFSAARQSAVAGKPDFAVFRNRLYDPRTGRWMQEDPLGVAGGLNLYQFNGNNPANYTDPFGLCPDPKKPDCPKDGITGYVGVQGSVVLGKGFTGGAGLQVGSDGVGVYGKVGAAAGLDMSAGPEVGIAQTGSLDGGSLDVGASGGPIGVSTSINGSGKVTGGSVSVDLTAPFSPIGVRAGYSHGFSLTTGDVYRGAKGEVGGLAGQIGQFLKQAVDFMNRPVPVF